MAVTNLKSGNLEELLSPRNFSTSQIKDIRNEIQQYDEYYLTSSGLFVKAFHQEFIHDPNMDLPPIPLFRLINYDYGVDAQDLEEVFQQKEATIPIITRVPATIKLETFQIIKNKLGGKSELYPITVPVPTEGKTLSPYLRPMQKDDLPALEQIFRQEYSLRYRMVSLLFDSCPEAGLIYEKDGVTIGATFNTILEDTLYMRLIYVRDGYRKRSIGRSLYRARLELAREKGVRIAKGHMRAEAWLFHKDFGAVPDEENKEYYVVRGI